MKTLFTTPASGALDFQRQERNRHQHKSTQLWLTLPRGIVNEDQGHNWPLPTAGENENEILNAHLTK